MSIAKAEHTFSEKQRIKFTHKGVEHHGVITGTNPRNLLIVRTDSGHVMLVDPRFDDAAPENFNSGAEPTKTFTPAHFDGLQRALALGKLDELDTYLTKKALANIVAAGCVSEADDATLSQMFSKHCGVAGDTFAKRAGSDTGFKVGDRIKDKWGCLGKITAIDGAHTEIAYDNGIQGTVLAGYFAAA